MTGSGGDDPDPPAAGGFVRSLLAPGRALGGHRELGTSSLARQLGLMENQLGGHWCSRCQGIWYGYMLEVECPACGNRGG